MNITKLAGILLLVLSGLIMIYTFIITIGTNCLDKASMFISLFALMYSIFLRLIE